MANLEFNPSKESHLTTCLCSKPIEDPFFINQYRDEIFNRIDSLEKYFYENKEQWKFIHHDKPRIDINRFFESESENATVLIYVCLRFKTNYSAMMEHRGNAKVKVWYNQNLLGSFEGESSDVDPYRIPISFLEGENHFLMEVQKFNEKWDFELNLVNYNNLPLKEYFVRVPYDSDDIQFAHYSLFDALKVDTIKSNIEHMDELNLELHSELNTCEFPETITGSIQITTKDHKICFERKLKHLPANIFRFNFNRVEIELPKGFYYINMLYESLLHEKLKNVGSFILWPNMRSRIGRYYERVKMLKEIVAKDEMKNKMFELSLPRVENKLIRFETIWNQVIHDSDDYDLIKQLDWEIEDELGTMESGKDPLENKEGYINLAYYHENTSMPVPFSVVIPKGYDPKKKYPVVLGLHGLNSNHFHFLKRFYAIGDRYDENSFEKIDFPDYGCIVVGITGFGSVNYDGFSEDDFFKVFNLVKKFYSVDEDRVYITGFSMGGKGALYYLTHYPDLFAAGALLCPHYDSYRYLSNELMSKITEEQKKLIEIYRYYNYLENLKDISLYIFHGMDDKQVPVENSRSLIEDLNALGFKKVYIEYSGVSHNIWDLAYENRFAVNLLLSHKRKPSLDFVFSSSDLNYNQYNYIRILKARKNRTLMKVHTYKNYGRLHITTRNVEVLEIITEKMEQYHIDSLVVNGEPVTLPKKGPKNIILELDEYEMTRLTEFTPAEEVPPKQGIFQAFKEWHTFVISNSVDKRMKSFLEKLTIYSKLENVQFPIKTAENADMSDDSLGNIVLVGTPDTNIHIKKLFRKLNIEYESNRLILFGREYHGSPVQTIFHFQNPYNPKKEIVCYLISHPDFIPDQFIQFDISYGFHHFTDGFVFNKDNLISQIVFNEDWPKIGPKKEIIDSHKKYEDIMIV